MFVFLGDSHSRQFQADIPGRWGHFSFSGATMRGLVNVAESRHGQVIQTCSAAAFKKRVFLMVEGMRIHPRFQRPELPNDNHADPAETLPLWQEELAEFAPAFGKLVAKRALRRARREALELATAAAAAA